MNKGSHISIDRESLLSSLDIQGWNMKNFAREIYDNTGQLLSLAKMQIAAINPEKKDETRKIVEDSDQLLNKAIKDLRSLAKQLTPNEIIRRGFFKSLHYELNRLNKSVFWTIELFSYGKTFRLEEIRELILFSIIQHYILKALYAEKAKQVRLEVNFYKDMINIIINYPINNELFSRTRLKRTVGIFKRAKLIDAVINRKRTDGQIHIDILIKKSENDQHCIS
jgi:signal transduction histidine kinase